MTVYFNFVLLFHIHDLREQQPTDNIQVCGLWPRYSLSEFDEPSLI